MAVYRQAIGSSETGVSPTTTDQDFFQRYRDSFEWIEGMLSFDDALLFFAYDQLIAAKGVGGDVLEIGVHHGLSAIAVAALRGSGHTFVAIDLFEEGQDQNVSGSGLGNRAEFRRNLARFFPSLDFVRELACPSSEVAPESLGGDFSFCHIDGGHSWRETFDDLTLCSAVLLPGGLVALDDYFNPSYPGVSEGAVLFHRERPDALRPIAIGLNKVLFQKPPGVGDLNGDFERTFPSVPHRRVTLWGQSALHFANGLAGFFDLARSRPGRLRANERLRLAARIEPATSLLRLSAGEEYRLPVRVENRSAIPFHWGSAPFGLSYHLVSRTGEMIRFDNPRTYFRSSLQPGEEVEVNLSLRAPEMAGEYRLVLDVVWEGIAWLADKGSQTAQVDVIVVPNGRTGIDGRDSGPAESSRLAKLGGWLVRRNR